MFVALPILAAAVGWRVIFNGKETPVGKAYRLCAECGLETVEVDLMIETARRMIDVASRAQLNWDPNLWLFRSVVQEQEDVVRFRPCAEAVLDAAG